MPSDKTLVQWGLLAKVESTYGVDASPVAGTDGLLVYERPTVTTAPLHDGRRGWAPGSGGPMPSVAPTGFESAMTAMMEGIGYGAAYSASNLPSVHVPALIAGLKATIDTTPSSESVTYAPETDVSAIDSATVYAYERGQLFKILGAHGENLTISGDGPGVPSWEVPIKGLQGGAPTDVAVPNVTSYPAASLLPPKAVNVSLDVGGVTSLVMSGFTFDLGRQDFVQRADENSAGHKGFALGYRRPSLELVVEASTLATFNPYTIRDNSTDQAVSFTIGSTQYNRWTFSAPQAKLVEVSEDDNGPVALWTLTFDLAPSDYYTGDEFSIVFD